MVSTDNREESCLTYQGAQIPEGEAEWGVYKELGGAQGKLPEPWPTVETKQGNTCYILNHMKNTAPIQNEEVLHAHEGFNTARMIYKSKSTSQIGVFFLLILKGEDQCVGTQYYVSIGNHPIFTNEKMKNSNNKQTGRLPGM